MRILHLVSRSQRRGAEMVALELATELDALGHENQVLALAPALGGGTDPELPPLVPTAELSAAARARCSWELRRLLADQPVDVVLAHGGWPAQVAAFGLPRRRPTLVWQRILDFPPAFWHRGRRRMWQAVARRVDAVAALTVEERDEMVRLGFGGPVWVIPNFRRPERFLGVDREKEAIRLREEVAIERDAPVIGFVGHLVTQKRPERALEVLAGVRSAGRDAHLVLAGDGPLREALEAEAVERGIAGAVTMLGHRNDVERVYAGVDLMVLTSDVEGIPGVVIEAAMAGCPVVSFPLGGVRMVVQDGVTGVVLDRPETALMTGRVLELLDDDARRERMGAEAQERSLAFSANRTAALYADRLAEAHAGRAERAPANQRLPVAGSRSRSDDLRRRGPNLFIIGAPRAGTTFTYHALRQAEGVYLSPVKEPGFFASTRDYRRGIDYYLDAYFARAEGHRFRGEATPWYLYSELARERIATLDLAAPPRSIVVLRRPAARALSMYRDQRRKGAEDRTFEQAVTEELAMLDAGRLAEDVRKRYLWCGRYVDHIEAWQDQFGPEHLHVVLFEELVADPEAFWRELAVFLGWELGPTPFDRLDERDKNPSGDLRWPGLARVLRSMEGRDNPLIEGAKRVLPPGLHRKALQQLGRYNRGAGGPVADAPDPMLMADLDAFFEPSNGRLEALLGRPLPARWHGAAASGADRPS